MSMASGVPAEVEVIREKAAWRAHAVPVLVLVVVPVLASALLLAGIFDNNPALFFSYLGVYLDGQVLHGAPAWLDPTIALLTQPFGRLSAEDWLHGVIPWWNPYTGIGMPLAAEMQSLSFFLPFVLLLKFWQGWLWLKVFLQIMSGLFMYALLIELGCRRIAAVVSGILFGLNGSFFLVPHAMGPIPFLPLLLLGVERAARAAREGRPLGWGVIPPALAYSLYAGYPEIAYIDGLLAGCWTLWRFAGLPGRRAAFAEKVAAGVGLGMALSLPLVVPFLGYVGQSYLGGHEFLFSIMTLRGSAAPLQIFPLTYGAPGTPSPVFIDWAQLGGWFGLPAVIAACAGLALPGRHRGLAFMLGGFVVFWQARIWGFAPAVVLADLIPDIARTDAVRFAGVAMEAALFIMAGIGIDAWMDGGRLSRRSLAGIVAFVVLVIAVSFRAAAPSMIPWFQGQPEALRFGLIADGIELAGSIALLGLLASRPRLWRAGLAAAIIGLDVFAVAFIPQLSAPRSGHLDLAGVRYLQRHQGLARFYTLQPFGPDYPAAFGLASINDNALPVALSWSRYIRTKLDPYADVVMFTGAQPRDVAGVPDQTMELRRHLAEYEATGVKYVLALPGTYPFRLGQGLPVGGEAKGFALVAGQTISGTIPPGLIRLREIGIAEVSVGTFKGAARGPLVFTLCAGGDCARGTASLDHAADNGYLPVRLDHDLRLQPDVALRYRITHPAGDAVAIWLGRINAGAPPSLGVSLGASTGIGAGRAPVLRFLGRNLVPGATQVFDDQVMTIYRLPRTRPFYTAPACRLTAARWNGVTADCARASTLLRLMAWFPGWSARINGAGATVSRTEDVFQAVTLPAGHSHVVFSYRPPGAAASVVIALMALVLWLGLMASPASGRLATLPLRVKLRRRQPVRRQPDRNP